MNTKREDTRPMNTHDIDLFGEPVKGPNANSLTCQHIATLSGGGRA